MDNKSEESTDWIETEDTKCHEFLLERFPDFIFKTTDERIKGQFTDYFPVQTNLPNLNKYSLFVRSYDRLVNVEINDEMRNAYLFGYPLYFNYYGPSYGALKIAGDCMRLQTIETAEPMLHAGDVEIIYRPDKKELWVRVVGAICI